MRFNKLGAGQRLPLTESGTPSIATMRSFTLRPHRWASDPSCTTTTSFSSEILTPSRSPGAGRRRLTWHSSGSSDVIASASTNARARPVSNVSARRVAAQLLV